MLSHTQPRGMSQATVYDDAHMGDSLAVVVHFTNKATQHAPGGVCCARCAVHQSHPSQELTTCAWINTDTTPHPHGDAMLVCGIGNTVVVAPCITGCSRQGLLRLVHQRRGVARRKPAARCDPAQCMFLGTQQHTGHTRPVLDVAGAASCPGRVASIAEGGDVRLWDAYEERCIGTAEVSGGTCLVRG